MEVQAEASSSASPGSIVFEVLMSFLTVPPPCLVGVGLSRHMLLYIRIDKEQY
jgi:hypothetical protein